MQGYMQSPSLLLFAEDSLTNLPIDAKVNCLRTIIKGEGHVWGAEFHEVLCVHKPRQDSATAAIYLFG